MDPVEIIKDLVICLEHTAVSEGYFCNACNYDFKHRESCTATTKSRTHCWSCDGYPHHEEDCVLASARAYLKSCGVDVVASQSVN